MSALIAYPDQTIYANLGGGSWLTTLPLANLQDTLMEKRTRSTDTLITSTKCTATFTEPLSVRVISVLSHNLSVSATIRVRAYSDSGFTVLVHDTGIQRAWPITFTSKTVAKNPPNWIWPLPTGLIVTAKYWLLEINDTTNSAGYVEFGRFWLSPAFEPATGVSYGGGVYFKPYDEIDSAFGGVDWITRRPSRRALQLTWPELSTAEKRQALLMQRELTTAGEFIWITDTAAEAEDMLLEAFPARHENISSLQFVTYNRSELPINLIEII